ncbi:DUF2971 domain-containing protein [Massilia endophytica]|uniref:DUF2971 domain-containing protein n=1 Tax=Massilia endophytica TaxID=2899220 RepID=UPI001E5D60EF|nr:DUF2971 domain-containing protein [Massilia endophytica]UGQ47207.1 DUF2971 domain-containing protein [Massilia endophytica]
MVWWRFNQYFNIFVFSLSEEDNLLSQWRSYTPHGKGVSIEIAPHVLKLIVAANRLKLGKCLYTDEDHSQVLLSLFEHLWGCYAQVEVKPVTTHAFRDFFQSKRGTILEALSLVKHGAFSEEREWRLIQCHDDQSEKISFREGPTMLIPYTKILIGEERRPFKSIRMGPSENPDLALASLLRFVGQNQLAQSVIRSHIPYRKL